MQCRADIYTGVTSIGILKMTVVKNAVRDTFEDILQYMYCLCHIEITGNSRQRKPMYMSTIPLCISKWLRI